MPPGGETISAADYLDAQRLRSVWVWQWRELFHPTLAGPSPPGAVQPVEGTVLLEEEPAVWPQFGP